MAPIATHLTVSEYDRAYGQESGWEYWFGVARQKPVPTHLHGLLQLLLGELLRLAGYVSSSEAELRNVADWRPRTIAAWDGEVLQRVADVALANGVTITGATIWSQLERRQQQQPPTSLTI